VEGEICERSLFTTYSPVEFKVILKDFKLFSKRVFRWFKRF